MNERTASFYIIGGVTVVFLLRYLAAKQAAEAYGFFRQSGRPVEDTDTLPDPKIPTEPPTPTTGISLGWAPALPVRPAFEAENWEDAKPRPGRFYAVKRRDHIEGIASKAIRSLAEEAAELARMPQKDAETWISQVSRSASLVRQAVDSLSTGWNDEMFGSERAPITAPHGRGIDLEANHDDVRQQLLSGRTPRRNLSAAGTPTKSGAKSRPYLWVPRWDAKHFLSALQAGETTAILSERDPYNAGITGHWPCPAVTERGVLHG